MFLDKGDVDKNMGHNCLIVTVEMIMNVRIFCWQLGWFFKSNDKNEEILI